jgi:hypothetical protein
MPYEERTLTRDQLYEDVWSRPVIQIAKDLGISDVALAKICRRLSVPLPPRGYWARIAAGRPARKPDLPKTLPSAPTSHALRVWRPPAEIVARQAPGGARTLPPIPVPATVENPHPLIRRTEVYLKRTGARDPDATALPAEAVLDIAATPPCADRALKIMDTILKALEARGHTVGVRERAPVAQAGSGGTVTSYETYALIRDEPVEFGLMERFDTIEIPAPPPSRSRESTSWSLPRPLRERIPNGRLMLYIRAEYGDHRQSWTDGKRQALEACLASFVTALEDTAEFRRLQEIERQRKAVEAEAQHQRWVAEQERQARQKALVEDLEKRTARWFKVQEARQLIKAVELCLAPPTDAAAVTATLRWLAWARRWADELEGRALSELPDPGLV